MEPAAIRTKNPGAMWPGPTATKWGSTRWIYLKDGTGQGGNGNGNKIAIFDTWVQGICAQLDLWRTSPRYKNKRLADAIAVWSGGNHVESYISYLIARVPGLTRNTIMDDAFWRSPMALQFLKAQSAHEAGKKIPAPDADWLEAQKRVLTGLAPPQPAPKPPASPKPAGRVAGTVVIATATVAASHQYGWWIAGIVAALGIAAFVYFKFIRK